MRSQETSIEAMPTGDKPINPDRRNFFKDGTLVFSGVIATLLSERIIEHFKSEQIDLNDQKAIEAVAKQYDISLDWLKATVLSLRDKPDMEGAVYTTNQWIIICGTAENGHLAIEVLKNQGPRTPKKMLPTKNEI